MRPQTPFKGHPHPPDHLLGNQTLQTQSKLESKIYFMHKILSYGKLILEMYFYTLKINKLFKIHLMLSENKFLECI